MADPNSPPGGRAVRGGIAPDHRRPSQWWKAPPPGTPFRHPHSEQRRPARAHAVGPVLGPHARTDRTRNTRVAEPWLPAPEDGRPGEGQRLTPDAPHNSGRPPPPGTAPHHPRGTQPPQGMQAKGTVLGPHTHTPAPTARGWRTPTARPVGRQSGEGQRLTSDAPHNGGRHPPPGTPFRHPHSEQRRPARAHAVGLVLGPHARTDRTQDTRIAEPRLPAPEDGRPGEGQRLTPDAPHNGGRQPPPGTAPHHPRGTQPPQGMQAKGTVLGPHTHTPAPTARGWRTPTARPVGGHSGEGQRLTSDSPHNGGRHPTRGRPSATPTASNAGPQGRTLWGRCWIPTPAPTAPGTHGSRNPGCPLQRTGGRGRDIARHQTPLTTVAGHPPRGRPPTTPAARSPTGRAGQGDSVGPPHPHNRAHSTWVADPDRPPSGRAVGGGTAPDLRRPSQWWKAPPPGHALPPPPQRPTPTRTGARCGAGAGSPRPHRPHPGHTGRGTLAARSTERAAWGGTAPDTRRPSQRRQATPPGDGPPTTPAARSPHRACRPRGQCWAPTPTHPRPKHVGGGPQQPAQWAGSRGRDSA